jgi:hypothetical protein
MPVDYYPNKSVEELVALLESLQKRQVSGGIIEVLAAGVRTTRDFSKSGTSRVEVEIKRVLYSLFLRAAGSDEAADWPNPYAGRIRMTRTRYTFS